VMLGVSFVMLLLVNTLQWYLQRRTSRTASAGPGTEALAHAAVAGGAQ
jgi:sulfate/thiosulfate transport system permease protein